MGWECRGTGVVLDISYSPICPAFIPVSPAVTAASPTKMHGATTLDCKLCFTTVNFQHQLTMSIRRQNAQIEFKIISRYYGQCPLGVFSQCIQSELVFSCKRVRVRATGGAPQGVLPLLGLCGDGV